MKILSDSGPGGNYQEKIDELKKKNELRPGVYMTSIAHDNWCALTKHGRPCNCDPDVNLINISGEEC